MFLKGLTLSTGSVFFTQRKRALLGSNALFLKRKLCYDDGEDYDKKGWFLP